MAANDAPPKPPRHRLWALRICIALTAAACVAAIAFRLPLCSRYWAWRLARATTPAQCSAYLAALSNAGDSAHWGIGALLASDDPAVRQYGVLVLQHLRSPWGRQRLLDALADADPSLQDLAALSLAMRGDDAVIPTLKWQYETGDAARAAAACRAFEHLRTPEAVATLLEMAVQPADAQRRAALVDTLNAIGTADCVPALLELLSDDRTCAVPARWEAPPAELLKRLQAGGYSIASTSSPSTRESPRTVAERAAAALAQITGIVAAYSSSSPGEVRDAARRQWADWWAAQRPAR